MEERFSERARKFVLLAEMGFARVGIFVHWEELAKKEAPETAAPKQEKPDRKKTLHPRSSQSPRPPRFGWGRVKRAALVLTIVLTAFQINNEALKAMNAEPDDAHTGGGTQTQVTQDRGGIYVQEGDVNVIEVDER